MPDRRNNDRVNSNLRCNRGRVIDLSRTGMRLLAKRAWREGDQRRILVRHNGQVATVHAECIWRRKEGTLRWVLGLAFVNPSDDAQAVLDRAVAEASDPLPILIPMGT